MEQSLKKKIWISIGTVAILLIIGAVYLLHTWGVFATSFKEANNDTLEVKQQPIPILELLEDKNPKKVQWNFSMGR